MGRAMAEFVLERRSDKRRERSEPIWWACGTRERKVGWLLERSARGAAFISVGRRAPRVAEKLEVSSWSADTGEWHTIRGYVRRVQRVHGDLYLIGMFCLVDRPRNLHRATTAIRPSKAKAGSGRPRTRLVAA